MENLKLNVIPFDGRQESWLAYKRKIKAFLDLNEKTSGIISEEIKEENANFAEKNRKVFNTIMLGLEGAALNVVAGINDGDGKSMLNALVKKYDAKTSAPVMQAFIEFIEMSEKGYSRSKYGDFHNFIAAYEEKYRRLCELEADKVQEKLKMALLLRALPDQYQSLRESIQIQPNMSWTKMIASIEPIIASREMGEKGHRKDAMGLKVKELTCFICNKPGHKKVQCKLKCKYCNKTGHKAEKCWFKDKANKDDHGHKATEDERTLETQNNFGFVANDNEHHHEEIIIDTAATKHMTGKRELLFDFRPAKGNRSVIGLGSREKVEGFGKIKIGEHILLHVRYVPSMGPITLISQRKLAKENGLGLIIERISGKAYLLGKESKYPLKDYDDLYIWDPTNEEKFGKAYIITETPRNATLACLHKRLGHINMKTISELAKIPYIRSQCTTCMLTKTTRKSIPKKRTRKLSSKPGDLIYMDIQGPTRTSSKEGYRYVIGAVDDYSRILYTIPTESKKIRSEDLKQIISAFRHKRIDIKKIRSDRGGEFLSEEFLTTASKEGIDVETTPSYCPEFNGMIERRWGIIMPMVRTLLEESGIPKRLWPEALRYANFILNRIPVGHIKGKSPIEIIEPGSKVLPKLIERSRIFGSLATVHQNKNKDKLGRTARLGYVVGMQSMNAYRIWMEDTDTIQVVYHVSINEQILYKDATRVGPYIEEEEIEGNNNENEDTTVSNQNQDDSCEDIMDRLCNIDTRNIIDSKRKSSRAYIAIVPETKEEALNSEDKEHWKAAMELELKTFKKLGVISKIEGKPDRAITTKWVFAHKMDKDGNVVRYKARLVARGFNQKKGRDYFDTYSPTPTKETLRILLAIANKRGYHMLQSDVNTAFLNAPLKEEIYVNIDGDIFKLHKAMYGLKQASRNWNKMLDAYLREIGFIPNKADPCLYKKDKDTYLLVYVDDIILAGPSEETNLQVMKRIEERFQLKKASKLEHILGMQIQIKDGIGIIHQATYIKNFLRKFQMEEANGMPTPAQADERLTTNNEEKAQVPYREAIGCLMYLATTTRPDICNAVREAAKHVENPSIQHWRYVKRIMKYLRQTSGYGLRLSRDKYEFRGYTDSDFANDESRKSISGYIFMYGDTCIAWRSSKQGLVTTSSAEAEYVAASEAAKEASYLKRLLEFFDEQSGPVKMFTDNMAALRMIENDGISKRTKHVDIKYHHVKDQIQKKEIYFKKVHTEDNLADMFTKNLSTRKFQKFQGMILCPEEECQGYNKS